MLTSQLYVYFHTVSMKKGAYMWWLFAVLFGGFVASAVAQEDNPIQLESYWNLTGGSALSLEFGPSSQTLAIGVQGGVALVDLSTKTLLHNLTGLSAEAYDVAYSPNGEIAAVDSQQGFMVWNEAGEVIVDKNSHFFSAYAVDYSSDGKELAVSTEGYGVVSVDIYETEGYTLKSRYYPDSDLKVLNLEFDPFDANLLLSYGDRFSRCELQCGTSVDIISNGQTLGLETLTLSSGSLNLAHASLSPDGKHLVAAVQNQSSSFIRVFDALTQTLVLEKEINRPLSQVRFTPDGNSVLFSTFGSEALWGVWNLSSDFITTGQASGQVLSLDVSPDGHYTATGKLVASGEETAVSVYHNPTKEALFDLEAFRGFSEPATERSLAEVRELGRLNKEELGVSIKTLSGFTRNGNLILQVSRSCEDDPWVSAVYNPVTGELKTFNEYEWVFYQRLLIARQSDTTAVYDTHLEYKVGTLPFDAYRGFSYDGHLFARFPAKGSGEATYFDTLELWNVASGELIASRAVGRFESSLDGSVVISKDRTSLFAVYPQGDSVVLEKRALPSLELLDSKTLSQAYNQLDLSPDGAYLIAFNFSGAVASFDVDSFEPAPLALPATPSSLSYEEQLSYDNSLVLQAEYLGDDYWTGFLSADTLFLSSTRTLNKKTFTFDLPIAHSAFFHPSGTFFAVAQDEGSELDGCREIVFYGGESTELFKAAPTWSAGSLLADYLNAAPTAAPPDLPKVAISTEPRERYGQITLDHERNNEDFAYNRYEEELAGGTLEFLSSAYGKVEPLIQVTTPEGLVYRSTQGSDAYSHSLVLTNQPEGIYLIEVMNLLEGKGSYDLSISTLENLPAGSVPASPVSAPQTAETTSINALEKQHFGYVMSGELFDETVQFTLYRRAYAPYLDSGVFYIDGFYINQHGEEITLYGETDSFDTFTLYADRYDSYELISEFAVLNLTRDEDSYIGSLEYATGQIEELELDILARLVDVTWEEDEHTLTLDFPEFLSEDLDALNREIQIMAQNVFETTLAEFEVSEGQYINVGWSLSSEYTDDDFVSLLELRFRQGETYYTQHKSHNYLLKNGVEKLSLEDLFVEDIDIKEVLESVIDYDKYYWFEGFGTATVEALALSQHELLVGTFDYDHPRPEEATEFLNLPLAALTDYLNPELFATLNLLGSVNP